jgi:hypothetical protein
MKLLGATDLNSAASLQGAADGTSICDSDYRAGNSDQENGYCDRNRLHPAKIGRAVRESHRVRQAQTDAADA